MAKKRFLNELLSIQEIDANFYNLKNIACNIFKYDDFENAYIMEEYLFYNGMCFLYYDLYTGAKLPLNITEIRKTDIYGRPTEFIGVANNTGNGVGNASANGAFRVDCINGVNGFLIYDKTDMLREQRTEYITRRYSEKLALCDRLIELNLFQQKATKIYQVPNDKVNTFKNIMGKIDTFYPYVMAYDGLNLEELTPIDCSTEYLSDKIFDIKEQIFDEYVQKVGGISYTEQKRERVTISEIVTKQGGSMICRESRYKTRKRLVEKFNKKFGTGIEVSLVQDINLMNGNMNEDEESGDLSVIE